MEKIIRILLFVLIALLAVLAAMVASTAYMESAYRNTFSGNYTYFCSLTTDAPLYNVTLFIPVPVDRAGNSPIAAQFSSRMMNGVPADWDTTLFDTGKSTLLKITTPAIVPTEGTTTSRPFAVTFSQESASPVPVDTRDPVENATMFRPVQALEEQACPPGRAEGSSRCFTFTTAVYAEYETAADTNVMIRSAITGKNSWDVFKTASNEYHAEVAISMRGDHHGWDVLDGELTSGSGTYNPPAISDLL